MRCISMRKPEATLCRLTFVRLASTVIFYLAVCVDCTAYLDEKICEDGFYGNKAHPVHCHKYILCMTTGLQYEMVCPKGLMFNVITRICDYDRNGLCADSLSERASVFITAKKLHIVQDMPSTLGPHPNDHIQSLYQGYEKKIHSLNERGPLSPDHDPHIDPDHHNPHIYPDHHNPHIDPDHHNPHIDPDHHNPHIDPDHHNPHIDPDHHNPHIDPDHHNPHIDPDHHNPHIDPDHHNPHIDPDHHEPHGENGVFSFSKSATFFPKPHSFLSGGKLHPDPFSGNDMFQGEVGPTPHGEFTSPPDEPSHLPPRGNEFPFPTQFERSGLDHIPPPEHPTETSGIFPTPGHTLHEVPGGTDVVYHPKTLHQVGRPVFGPNPTGSLVDQAVDFLHRMMPHLKETVRDRLHRVAQKARGMREHRGRAFAFASSLLGSLGPAKGMSLVADLQLECLQMVKQKFNLDKAGITRLIRELPSMITPMNMRMRPHMHMPPMTIDHCPFPMNNATNECDAYAKYRTIDGSCNNLLKPLWGKSFRPLDRFLPPDYADGIEAPRVSVSGRPLPSAREVILSLHPEEEHLSPIFTVMMQTFGQFLDHDMGRTAVSKLSKNANGTGDMVDVECGMSGCDVKGDENTACFPIRVPSDDPDFGYQRECLMFVRTQPTPKDNCPFTAREQLNQLTSYLDASMIYGSTMDQLDDLRDPNPRRGRLKVTQHDHPDLRPLLPQKENKNCRDVNKYIQCFNAGDGRVNEQIGLISLHTSFHRYHNLVEDHLYRGNPHWGGERLFQEARKIVSAIWQHIVFNEYVPLVLGPNELKRHDLNLQRFGFYNAYDDSVNVDTTNVFQTAAFRFGHSQITTLLRLTDSMYQKYHDFEFSSVFRRPYEVYNTDSPAHSGVDSIILGMAAQPTEKTDRFFTKQVTRSMFTDNPPHGLGMDLPSTNTQRGRDHGIPGYNEWRSWCGLPRARSFDDLADLPSEVIEKFRYLYRHVDDIDLFPAGVSEMHVPGGSVGPTFACIIARQFRRSRVADRFWYERKDPVVGFKLAQINEIRKMTLSKIFCNTLDHVATIQKFVMLQPYSVAFSNLGSRYFKDSYSLASHYKGDRNERRPCSHLPDIDLSLWNEAPNPESSYFSSEDKFPYPLSDGYKLFPDDGRH